MARMAPISRRELIRRLKELGFRGPFHGSRHDFMVRDKDEYRLPLPRDDAKSRDIGVSLQKRIIKEIAVAREQWMAL